MGWTDRSVRFVRLLPLLIATAIMAVLATLLVTPAVAGGAGAQLGARGRGAVPYQNAAAIEAAALSPSQTNTVYVPVTPCRLVDSRAAGGKLGNGTTRSFAVYGNSGFGGQGGNGSGCGIPAAATSITVSITAVGPSAAGWMLAYPAGSAMPNASVLNYNGGLTTNSGATVPIKPNANPGLTVTNYGGVTDLIIDVSGYYAPQMHGMVSPATPPSTDAPIYSGTSRIVSATNPSAGVYLVTFDTDITYCTPVVQTYNAGSGVYGVAYNFNGNVARVYTWYLSATTHVEVMSSFYFYIEVIC
jgi:hypothetical protein